ncbi:hypothetical protein HBI06_024450 [Parastagonospora nodorum]|nr:hypothetical protein HBI05_231950 [Parastagonospora nodorum]KAH4240181.1 hypothetical protein HBI06_024450 [Parastagonospora nodorum]
MGQQKEHKASVPVPLYVLLFIVIGLCAWSFWIGTVCVRLWFYKGALGPVPEMFIIIPHHRKEKEPAQAQSLPPPTIKNGRNTVFPTVAHLNCNTVFPAVAHLATKPTNPFSDDHAVPDASEEWRTIPKITIEDSDEPFDNAIAQEYADPARVRKFLAEERRISRLPTFDQDDCGDGSEFPEVPYAIAPVEPWAALTYRQLGLQKVNNTSAWLTINNSYIEHHEARMSLLERKQADCVQVRHDGEAACEELADLVVQHLCKAHPDHFTAKLKGRRRHVRNELASKEYALVRPFDCHPLGLCARLAVEDFCIWRRGEFTLGWYLQASATLFPAGWNLRHHIGKSLSSIINDPFEPLPLWHDLPDILNLPYTPTTLYTRHTTFIQTLSLTTPLTSTLHIPRPADFFSGGVQHLVPQNLYIRREYQSFRQLAKSGAVVMTSRTELTRLTDVAGRREKDDLMAEIRGWGEDEAGFKGRDLWSRAVGSWCEGGSAFRDDVTVITGVEE